MKELPKEKDRGNGMLFSMKDYLIDVNMLLDMCEQKANSDCFTS